MIIVKMLGKIDVVHQWQILAENTRNTNGSMVDLGAYEYLCTTSCCRNSFYSMQLFVTILQQL